MAGALFAGARCECFDPTTLPDGAVVGYTYHNKGELALSGALDAGYTIDAIAGTQDGHFNVGMTNTEGPGSLFAFSADLGTATPAIGTFDQTNSRGNTAVSTAGSSWTQNSTAGQAFSLQLTSVDASTVEASPTSGVIHGSLDATLVDTRDGGSSVVVHAEF